MCLYFSIAFYPPCTTPLLTKACEELKSRGEPFEMVLISLKSNEDDFKEDFKGMPWLVLPFKDQIIEKLPPYFELRYPPNSYQRVEEHGVIAYLFSREKVAVVEKMGRARQVGQTLESLLVSDELDYVIAKDGHK
ncbi:hypothetical protein Taro_041115, partial [Colocasia esculenta]|nr:hypothetical protein [Colocasia esculenta]